MKSNSKRDVDGLLHYNKAKGTFDTVHQNGLKDMLFAWFIQRNGAGYVIHNQFPCILYVTSYAYT